MSALLFISFGLLLAETSPIELLLISGWLYFNVNVRYISSEKLYWVTSNNRRSKRIWNNYFKDIYLPRRNAEIFAHSCTIFMFGYYFMNKQGLMWWWRQARWCICLLVITHLILYIVSDYHHVRIVRLIIWLGLLLWF